jgi:CheY-like chemotaxis protein
MAHSIIIADDSKTIRRVVEIAFARQGDYSLVAAGSGEEAIQKAREIRPSLVLADHNMDGKDGYDVAEALIPEGMKVLLLTGSSKDFDEARASAIGVEKFDKPFDCQTLLEKVAALVGAEPPAPAPGLRPVGSTPIAIKPQTPATPAQPATPATPTAPVAPKTPPVAPTAPSVPQAAGWQASSGGALSGATGGDGNAAVDNLGAAAAAAATAAVVEKAAPAVAAQAASSGNGAPSEAAVSAAAREIIERVVWEVVPELAETLIREEIERLLKRG